MSPGRTPDLFHGQFVPDRVGLWTFRVDGWGDPITTWRHAVTAKLDAGQGETELDNDLDGRRAAAGAGRHRGAARATATPLLHAAAALREPGDPVTRAALGAVA